MKKTHPFLPCAALLLATMYLLLSGAFSLWNAPFLAAVEDTRWQVFPRERVAGLPVAVVDLDETTLSRYGYWPWPRERMVALVRRLLEEQGAAAVALDILYPEASGNPAADAALGHLARTAPVVLAQTFDLSQSNAPRTLGQVAGGQACPAGLPVPQAQGVIAPGATLGPGVRAGHITPAIDADGHLRRAWPLVRYRDRCYPALSMALLGAAARLPDATVWKAGSGGGLENPVLGIHLPLQADGSIRLPWPVEWPPVIPAAAVLDARLPLPALHNSLVVVGSSAAGLGDLVTVPGKSRLPGVMVHAVQAQAMLSGTWMQRPGWGVALTGLYVFLLAWGCLWLAVQRHPWLGLTLALTGGLVWVAVNATCWRQGLDLPLLPPLFCVLLQWPLQSAWQGLKAQRAQRLLFRQFSAYLPRRVLDELVRSGADPRTLDDARRCDITVLFADIVGFTRLAEQLAPEQVAQLLNIVMSHLGRLVHRHEGTLDKYIGDALMAFWGAPLPQADHADRAVACAETMLADLPAINHALRQVGLPAIRLGIGVNSGEAAVGNLGSSQRRAYSAVGDTVNVAARLESLTRVLDQPLLLGEDTCRRLRTGAIYPLGCFELRGRSRASLVGARQCS